MQGGSCSVQFQRQYVKMEAAGLAWSVFGCLGLLIRMVLGSSYSRCFLGCPFNRASHYMERLFKCCSWVDWKKVYDLKHYVEMSINSGPIWDSCN